MIDQLKKYAAYIFLAAVSIIVASSFVFGQNAVGTQFPLAETDGPIRAEASVQLACPTEEGMLNLLDNWDYWVAQSSTTPPHGCIFYPPGMAIGPYFPQYRYLDAEGDFHIIYETSSGAWTFNQIPQPNV